MASAARVHIAERGRDPRRYALVCTGGGGPVNGYGVARKLGIKRLVCPPSPGVASAWGLLVAPARVDRVRTVAFRLDSDPLAAFEAAFCQLEKEAREVVAATGLPLTGLRVDRLGDGRCVGQGFDLVVALPPGPYVNDAPGAPPWPAPSIVAIGKGSAVTRPLCRSNSSTRECRCASPQRGATSPILRAPRSISPMPAIKGRRRAWFAEAGGFVDTIVYDRDRLPADTEISGPALIEDPGSTLVIGPSGHARVMPSGSIIVELG